MAYKDEDQRLPVSLPPYIKEIILNINIPGKPTQRVIWLIEEGLAAHPELQRNDRPLHSVPPKNPETTTQQ